MASLEYGLPDFTPELKARLKAGQIRLGGGLVTGDDHEWQCADCGAQIHRQDSGPGRV